MQAHEGPTAPGQFPHVPQWAWMTSTNAGSRHPTRPPLSQPMYVFSPSFFISYISYPQHSPTYATTVLCAMTHLRSNLHLEPLSARRPSPARGFARMRLQGAAGASPVSPCFYFADRFIFLIFIFLLPQTVPNRRQCNGQWRRVSERTRAAVSTGEFSPSIAFVLTHLINYPGS